MRNNTVSLKFISLFTGLFMLLGDFAYTLQPERIHKSQGMLRTPSSFSSGPFKKLFGDASLGSDRFMLLAFALSMAGDMRSKAPGEIEKMITENFGARVSFSDDIIIHHKGNTIYISYKKEIVKIAEDGNIAIAENPEIEGATQVLRITKSKLEKSSSSAVIFARRFLRKLEDAINRINAAEGELTALQASLNGKKSEQEGISESVNTISQELARLDQATKRLEKLKAQYVISKAFTSLQDANSKITQTEQKKAKLRNQQDLAVDEIIRLESDITSIFQDIEGKVKQIEELKQAFMKMLERDQNLVVFYADKLNTEKTIRLIKNLLGKDNLKEIIGEHDYGLVEQARHFYKENKQRFLPEHVLLVSEIYKKYIIQKSKKLKIELDALVEMYPLFISERKQILDWRKQYNLSLSEINELLDIMKEMLIDEGGYFVQPILFEDLVRAYNLVGNNTVAIMDILDNIQDIFSFKKLSIALLISADAYQKEGMDGVYDIIHRYRGYDEDGERIPREERINPRWEDSIKHYAFIPKQKLAKGKIPKRINREAEYSRMPAEQLKELAQRHDMKAEVELAIVGMDMLLAKGVEQLTVFLYREDNIIKWLKRFSNYRDKTGTLTERQVVIIEDFLRAYEERYPEIEARKAKQERILPRIKDIGPDLLEPFEAKAVSNMFERGKIYLLSMHQLLYLEAIFERAENRLRIQKEMTEAKKEVDQLLGMAKTLLLDARLTRDGEVKLLCEAIAGLPEDQAIVFGKQFIDWVNTEGNLKFGIRGTGLTNILMSLTEILPDEVIGCVRASLMHESPGFVYNTRESVNKALMLLGSMIEKNPGAKEVLSEFAKNRDIRKFYLWWKHGGIERKVSDILKGIEPKGKAMGKEDVSSAAVSIDEQLGNLKKIVQEAMGYIEGGKFKEAEKALLKARNLLADTDREYMKIFTLAEGEALKGAIKHSIKTDSTLAKLSDLIEDGIKVLMRPRCLEALKDLSRDKVHILQEGTGDSFKSTLDEVVRAIIKENPLFEDYNDELSITVEQVASTFEIKEEAPPQVVITAEPPLLKPGKAGKPVLVQPEVQYIIEARTFLQELNARKEELDNARETLARAEKRLKELKGNKETRPGDISEAESRITTLRHRIVMREARIGDIQTSVTNLLREHPDVGYMFPESFKAPGKVTPKQKNLFEQVKTEDMGYLLFYDQAALSGLMEDNNGKKGIAEEGLNFVQRCLRSIKERKKILAAIEKIQVEINEKGYETVSAGLIKLSFAILFEHREWFTENDEYLQRFLSILKDLKIEDKKDFGTTFFDSEEWARRTDGTEVLEDSFVSLRDSMLETLKRGYKFEPFGLSETLVRPKSDHAI